MLRQLARSKEEVEADEKCIGTCTINEDGICIGCHRREEEILNTKNNDRRRSKS